MRTSFSLLAIWMVLVIPSGWSQGNLKKHSSDLIEHGKYLEALEVLNSFSDDDKSYYLQRGICHFHASQLDNAYLDLTAAFEKGESSSELLKYLARTHHLKGEYYEAARAYKLYLNEIDRKHPERMAIIHAIKNCDFGRKAVFGEQAGFVENLGQAINSPYDEIAPLRSPNYESRYYYSSNKQGSTGGLRNSKGLKDEVYGSHSYDIYTVEKVDGAWTPASGVPPLLNSARNEIIQGFNNDGKILIFLKFGHGQESVLVSDTFSLDLSSKPIPLTTPANASLGDKDLFFINDSTFLFSSKRKGGYGGYDIYFTTFENGEWMEPANLGPEINTAYDEETPFLTNSNTIIYFSSNRKESIGGYDIFYANYGIERGKWLPAENIGLPISSPGNDQYFRLSQDGRSAILSSDRQESMGGYDLFVAYMKQQVYEQLTYASSVPFLSEIRQRAGDIAEAATSPAQGSNDPGADQPNPAPKVREMVVTPLFYETNDVLSSGNNGKALKDLLDMMMIFPDLKATITGHTHYGGSNAYDIYFSIKSAEQASNYLIKNGIAEERIAVYGVGSNYPMVKSLGTNLATKNNNRIEIKLTDHSQNRLTVTYTYPVINDYLKDDRAETFRNTLGNTIFRIEVADVKQMYDNPEILGLKDVVVRKNFANNSYTYSVGNTSIYQEALEIKNDLIRRGFTTVAMNVYHQGFKLSQDETRKMQGNNSELAAYITNELR